MVPQRFLKGPSKVTQRSLKGLWNLENVCLNKDLPVWILWWAFKWELLVYTLVQPGWSQKCMRLFSRSGLFRRLYLIGFMTMSPPSLTMVGGVAFLLKLLRFPPRPPEMGVAELGCWWSVGGTPTEGYWGGGVSLTTFSECLSPEKKINVEKESLTSVANYKKLSKLATLILNEKLPNVVDTV